MVRAQHTTINWEKKTIMQLYTTTEYAAFLAVLDAEIKQRQNLIENVKALFPKSAAAKNKPTITRSKRKPLSKAARARIAEAQRKRWAAQKREQKTK